MYSSDFTLLIFSESVTNSTFILNENIKYSRRKNLVYIYAKKNVYNKMRVYHVHTHHVHHVHFQTSASGAARGFSYSC